jgi:Tol biopolymer transport system component
MDTGNHDIRAYQFKYKGERYELNLSPLKLLKGEEEVKHSSRTQGLQPQQLKILKFLLENRNGFHTRLAIAEGSDIKAKNEGNISTHIHHLRNFFGDQGQDGVIKTLPGRAHEGEETAYRIFPEEFEVLKLKQIATTELAGAKPSSAEEGEVNTKSKDSRKLFARAANKPDGAISLGKWLGWILLLIGVISGGLLIWERLRLNAITQTQITFTNHLTPVRSMAVSPDGLFIAWVERTGEGEKTIGKLRDNRDGSENPIPALDDSEIFRLSWLPDSKTLLVSGKRKDEVGIWLVPTLAGRPPEKVPVLSGEVGEAGAFNRSRIAYVSGNRNEIYLTGMNGEPTQQLLKGRAGDDFNGLVWLEGGRRLLFNRLHLTGSTWEITVETLDADTGSARTVVENNPQLRAGCASPGGQIFYSLQPDPPNHHDTGLWEMSIDPRTGDVTRQPREVIRSNGANVHGLSLAADGNHLMMLKGSYQADVLIGEIDRVTGQLTSTLPLTRKESNEFPTAWSRDSQKIYFHSNRGGRSEIFRQAINSTQEERIIYGVEEYRGARITPDGENILFLSRPGDWLKSKLDPLHLRVASINGENARELYKARALLSMRCPQLPATRCVMSERSLLPGSDLVFRDLGQLKEAQNEIARTTLNLPLGQEYWDLSPDGSQIAVVVDNGQDGIIRILGLDGTSRDLIVRGHGGFHSMDWADDGKGLYTSSRSARSADLLYVDLEGKPRVIWTSADGFETWGVPSPDGRHLAILDWTAIGNIWAVDNIPALSSFSPSLLLYISVLSISGGLILLYWNRFSGLAHGLLGRMMKSHLRKASN